MPLVVEPDWVGRRIVVRRAVDRDESGRLLFADVVGDLVELTADTATVEASGGPVHVPVSHIAVAKVVEPSAAEILALSAVSSRGWRAEETAEVGGWRLRANHGVTNRANSALPLRRPSTSLSDTLDAARKWYTTRGLPVRVQTPLHARRLLDAELAERGWPASHETLVLAPDQRRQGLATAIVHALWRWGTGVHGAKHSYLEVEADNEPAITLYRGLGYWEHHVYRYRTEPA